MKYHSFIPSPRYSHNNKLDEAVQALLKEFNNFVFEPKRLPVVKSSVINGINALNAQHSKRCKPIEPKWENSPLEKTTWFLYLSQVNQYQAALKLTLCREESDL